MTNKELKKVLEKHKKWVDGEEGGERAVLVGADLRDADLTDANLRDADLCEADLRGADLTKANLRGANLRGAAFYEANLSRADLRGADLSCADLCEANLREANLSRANLSGADLDYSCWPLWCGSLDVKVDKRVSAQLAYHFCRLDCDDPEHQEAKKALSKLANQFHRIDECGKIENHT